MIKRKYVVLALLTLVSVVLGGLLYSSIGQAQSTVTGYASVSAAAFRPTEDGYDFANYGDELHNVDGTSDFYYASVQLPHGATVTQMTFYWSDTSALTGVCHLYRFNHDFSSTLMAAASTTGAGGHGSSTDSIIDNPTIDNFNHSYHLYWYLPDANVWGHSVTINYTLPSAPAGAAVGGLYVPVDKLSLLAPYITLVVTIIIAISASVAYIKYRKKQ